MIYKNVIEFLEKNKIEYRWYEATMTMEFFIGEYTIEINNYQLCIYEQQIYASDFKEYCDEYNKREQQYEELCLLYESIKRLVRFDYKAQFKTKE